MEFSVREHILHITYTDKNQLSDIIEICNSYEQGNYSTRIGFNFPLSFVKNRYPTHFLITKYNSNVKYVIVYRTGDIQTKKHELQHAKYYLDNNFRQEVKQLWKSLSDKSKTNVINFLTKTKYARKVWIDEFQAYYFTEKKNFFGKLEFSL